MFSIKQKLFLAKVIVGVFICSTAIFLSLYISLMTQYNLAIEMLREHLEVIHDTEANHHDLKRYLSKKENQELKEELSENRKQIMTLTNFVLASAIKRADGTLVQEDIENLRKML